MLVVNRQDAEAQRNEKSRLEYSMSPCHHVTDVTMSLIHHVTDSLGVLGVLAVHKLLNQSSRDNGKVLRPRPSFLTSSV